LKAGQADWCILMLCVVVIVINNEEKIAELERTLAIAARQISTALNILQHQDTDIRNHECSVATSKLLGEFGLKKQSRVKSVGVKKWKEK